MHLPSAVELIGAWERGAAQHWVDRALTMLSAAYPEMTFAELATLTIGAQNQEQKDETKKEDEGLPLKPDGKIEFTTDEGTWMSLDVSPDGQTIIFDLLGDLYTLPIAGGEARRIIGGMSFESQPRFSPDGRTLLVTGNRRADAQ